MSELSPTQWDVVRRLTSNVSQLTDIVVKQSREITYLWAALAVTNLLMAILAWRT